MQPYIRILLRSRNGRVRAWAYIDEIDAAQAAHRWCLHSQGYVVRRKHYHDGSSEIVFLHREIFGLVPGDGVEVDHKNRVRKLDNRRSNLRVVTPAQNKQNTAARVGSTSSYIGVSWFKLRNNWRATCYTNGKQKHLGYFDDEHEAGTAVAVWRAAHLLFSAEATPCL